MAAPKFVERLARLPEVLNVLTAYPEGLELAVLAGQFGVGTDVMREDLVTYMDIESWGWTEEINIFTPPVLEFIGGDDDPDAEPDDVDDRDATVVRVVNDAPAASIGVEYLSAGDLALIYTAGLALLDAGDDDEDLRDGLEVIAETMYGEPAAQPSPAEWNKLVPLLQQAQAQRRRVDIEYSNAWRVQVTERTIEPLRLLQTQRGWEVDAGPLGEEGNLRTFLVSNIRSATLSEETFEPPTDVDDRLQRQRRTTTVRMAMSQGARWAPDTYAEHVTVVDEDDAEFIADMELLPPVSERVALLMLASGGATRVLDPISVVRPACDVVEALLAHHSGVLK